MLKWADVAKIHQTWKGVYSRGGFAISLLCNPHDHGRHGDDSTEAMIAYRVPRRSHAADANALISTMKACRTVRVFEKLGTNQWLDRGDWRLEDYSDEDMAYCFRLITAEGSLHPDERSSR